MNEIQISEIYRKLSVKKGTSLEEAINCMVEFSVSGLAVVDERNHLVGVISAKDFLRDMISSKYHNLILGNVEDYMASSPKSIKDHCTITDVIDIFIKNSHHYFPIVNSNGEYKGTIYRNQLLKCLMNIKASTW